MIFYGTYKFLLVLANPYVVATILVYGLLTESFHRSGFRPRRSLEVILFTSEEPTRFGISCLGRSLSIHFLINILFEFSLTMSSQLLTYYIIDKGHKRFHVLGLVN